MALIIVPLELRDANAFVQKVHRHHGPVAGHRSSLGAYDAARQTLVGVAIVGRPVSRMINGRTTLEVTRLATDGTKNACSLLYAAAARAGRSLGYHKIQTYILSSEPGVSLRAAGWQCETVRAGGKPWNWRGRPRKDQPVTLKQRWSKILNPPLPDWQAGLPAGQSDTTQPLLQETP